MFPWSFVIELSCLIMAILFLRDKFKVGNWNYFIYYLSFIVLLEGTGWSLWFIFKLKNHWLYNIELPITFLFIWWILKDEFRKFQINKIWFISGLIIFFTVYMYDIFQNRFTKYNQQSATARSILFLIAAGMYYFYLTKQEHYFKISIYPSFWFVTGIFLFFFISTATNLFFKELSNIYLFEGIPLHHVVFTFLNFLLYSCWAYAFRCKKYLQNT